MNTDSQPEDAWPGTSGAHTRQPERKHSRRHSPVLLVTVLAGLAAIAVVAGVLLTRAPSAQPVTSAVSYRFAAHRYHDGLVAVRRWTLGGRDGSLFTETITASSASGKALLVQFEEPIPAAIAANLNMVRFRPAPSKIVKADPVVEWRMRVPAHGTVTVGYQATVAPAGATKARLTRWVTDFNQLAVTVKPGPVKRSGSSSGTGSGSSGGSGNWVVVPDVSGQTQSHATTTLQDDGLTVNPATTSNCAASSNGQVVGQTPSEGTTVHQGSAVVITVCSASQPANLTVPSLLGLPESQAEAVLQSDGLIAAPTLLPNCEAGSAGQVVQQSPDAGTAIQQGHAVEIGICEPPTPSPTPTPTPSPT